MAKGTPFTLENLRMLDFGRVNAAFAMHLDRIHKDCLDRPGDPKPRTLSLVIRMIPILDSTDPSNSDRVKLECEVFDSVPKHRSRIFEMSTDRDGKIVFNPDKPEDAESETIFADQERKEDGR